MEHIHAAARTALGCPSAEIVEWEAKPIEYRVYLPGRSLTRVSGTARCDGRDCSWSTVRKSGASPREILAYNARWLDVAGFRAARSYVAESAELWLEDLSDAHAHRWPLAAFRVASRALGRFNGSHLVSPPRDETWLSRDWIDKHQERAALELRPSEHRVQSSLRQTLLALPQTICHHDAAQANLFIVAGEVVAIDWEGVGWGAVGADLATLVVGTMRRGDFDARNAEELERVAFAGYTQGLADVGWNNFQVARLGYSAAVGLRWSIAALAPQTPLARFVQARADEAVRV
jgi:hypothetical protein